MDNAEELKPCQCGDEVTIHKGCTGYFYECACGICCYAETKKKFITVWNSRPVEDRLRRQLEAAIKGIESAHERYKLDAIIDKPDLVAAQMYADLDNTLAEIAQIESGGEK